MVTPTTKTTAELLEAAKARVAVLEQRLLTESITTNIEANDEVEFKYGRADTVRTIAGRVLGAKDGWVMIASGEGFDLQTYKVRLGDITKNDAAEARAKSNDPLSEA